MDSMNKRLAEAGMPPVAGEELKGVLQHQGYPRNPNTCTTEIVASVLDGIISDVERKAKNRARKQRQKAKKKRDKEYSWFMSPKKKEEKDKHFYVSGGDSAKGLELSYSIAKRTEDELKPLGYKFVDYYDTIFYDECEKPLLKYNKKTMNGGATKSKIPSGALAKVGKKYSD